MAQVDGDLVVVSKSCSWPPSCNGSIDTVLEVLMEEGSDSSVANSLPESISSYEDATGLHFARPTADSGPFEITVAFQPRLCHLRTIYILSSARTCEIYSQQAGSNDVEYVCTARGELLESDKDSATDEADAVVAEFLGSASCSKLQQVVEGGVEEVNGTAVANEPLYEIEVELVNSDAWAAVRLRLLSLHDKLVVKIKRVIISAHVGPPPSTEAVSNGNGSSSSSLMAMLMPTMLQMMRSGSRAGDQTLAENHQRPVQPATHEKPETRPSALSSDPLPTTTANLARCRQPEAEEQDFRNEIRDRLQNLEMICSRMESYLHQAFGKLDDRVGNLELQNRTMQEHFLFAPSSAESSDQLVPLQAPPPSEPVLAEAGAVGEEPDHDAREEQEQEDEPPEDIQQVEPEDMQQIAPVQTHSEPVLTEAGVAGEEAHSDTEAEQEQEDEPEDMQQIEPEDVQQIASAETHSISLDDAWVSALTAFSSEACTAPAESSKDDPQRLVDAEPDVLVREAGNLIDADLRSPPAEAPEDQGQLSAQDLPNESALKKGLPALLDMEHNVAGQDGTDKQQAASGGTIDLTELLGSSEVAETGNTASDAEVISDASDLVFLPSYEERDAPQAAKAEEHPSESGGRRSVEDRLLELTPEL